MSAGTNLLLDAADAIRQRGAVYGSARDNMQRTAAMWSPVLGIEVTRHQVAICLMLLKIARLVETPDHADSVIDIAGYAAVLRECQDSI